MKVTYFMQQLKGIKRNHLDNNEIEVKHSRTENIPRL